MGDWFGTLVVMRVIDTALLLVSEDVFGKDLSY
jgi:hypothetical protein